MKSAEASPEASPAAARLPARLLPWLPLWPALAVILAWAPSLTASFQFDDWTVIVQDDRVQTLTGWWLSMPGIRPLLKLSYALNHHFGAAPFGFRLVNVLLHALNATLVLALLRRLALRWRIADAAGAACIAATATLLFALHPVQTESVTYVSGRSNALMACFALLALWLGTSPAQGLARLGRQALVLVCTLAALATKESAVVIPLALWLVNAPDPQQRPRTALAAALPAAWLVLAALLTAFLLFPYDDFIATSLAERAPLASLRVHMAALPWLFGQMLRFDLLNADPALPALAAPPPLEVLMAFGLALALLGALWQLRRRPAIAFGILWFLLWLAPTHSLVARLDVANDRELYLACIGIGWLLGLALNALRRHWLARQPNACQAALLVFGALLASGTLLRNRAYATETTFWRDVVAKAPHNVRAANNLGIAEALACHPGAARAAFTHALALEPGNARAGVNLILLRRGEIPGQPPSLACR